MPAPVAPMLTPEMMASRQDSIDKALRYPYQPMAKRDDNGFVVPKLVAVVDDSGLACTFDSEGNPIMPKVTVGSCVKSIMDVFLPAGYPQTVTSDYTAYQIYDSLQAFSSSIAGLLSSRAVLQGFGVGDSASSATAAVLLTVLQEATGRLATIMFAHYHGRAIEPECKFYRFLADIVNDSALFLDVLSPALPFYPKVIALCGAGVLRALCGVSGGAAKASLSAHFAKNGNLAELNAKDGSQETVISLLGMLVGSMFVQYVHGKTAVWAWMVVLVVIHLWTNYKAVTSVQMRTLNRQRTIILTKAYFGPEKAILRPDQVAARECILTCVPQRKTSVNGLFARKASDARLIKEVDRARFCAEDYIIVSLWNNKPIVPIIFMKEHATTKHTLQAWIEASYGLKTDKKFWAELKNAGWDLETNALETGRCIRLVEELKEE
ncbi:vitamin B6 photo-protection and homoeostasis-domain-containing protein [Hypoxylon sp. FL1284]|nr:vitamin B6 photo-protection and homoeostasis-domain-containing protein [Hypoxylon sp. FL1284]